MARPVGTHECCYDEDGELRPENVQLVPDHPDARSPDLTVSVCKVCGCRHFQADAEPGVIGLKGAPIGAGAGPGGFFIMEGGSIRAISAQEFFDLVKSQLAQESSSGLSS